MIHSSRVSTIRTTFGADRAMVQARAGHASPTTARYDRRPDDARREAARRVHVPYIGNTP